MMSSLRIRPANSRSSSQIRDGTLQPPIDTAAPYKEGSIVVADFNHDSKVDIAFTNTAGVYIAPGNGDGTFGPPTSLTAFGGNGVASGDLNNDGVSDLILAGAAFPAELRVLLGNPDGTFQDAQVYGTNSSVSAIAIADFDNDGHDDVAVGEGTESEFNNSISVLLGGPDGMLSSASYIGDVPGATRAYFAGLAGDFDGNGTLDYVAQNVLTGEWGVQLSGTDGRVSAAPTTVASGFAQAVGDFDGDGNLDIILGASGSVSWLRGSGNGGLGAPITTSIVGTPRNDRSRRLQPRWAPRPRDRHCRQRGQRDDRARRW